MDPVKSQRLYKWDNIKGILITLVVVGHFIEPYLEVSDIYSSIWIFIYTFHMPLFIFAAGFFHSNKNIRSKVTYYLFLYVLMTVLLFAFDRMLGFDIRLHLLNNDGTPWFMLLMAFCTAITYLLRDCPQALVLVTVFLVGINSGYDPAIGDMLCLSRLFVFYPFYYMGYCLKLSKKEELSARCNTGVRVLSAAGILVWFALCLVRLDQIYLLRPFFTGRNSFEASAIPVEGGLIRILCYILSIAMCALIIFCMTDKPIPLLSIMGTRTIQIYFCHRFIRDLLQCADIETFLRQGAMFKILWLILAMAVAAALSVKALGKPFDALRKACNR